MPGLGIVRCSAWAASPSLPSSSRSGCSSRWIGPRSRRSWGRRSPGEGPTGVSRTSSWMRPRRARARIRRRVERNETKASRSCSPPGMTSSSAAASWGERPSSHRGRSRRPTPLMAPHSRHPSLLRSHRPSPRPSPLPSRRPSPLRSHRAGLPSPLRGRRPARSCHRSREARAGDVRADVAARCSARRASTPARRTVRTRSMTRAGGPVGCRVSRSDRSNPRGSDRPSGIRPGRGNR